MQVIGQHHPTMDDEGMTLPYRSHRLAQQVHMPDQQVVILPLQQIDGEEVSAARMPGATVIRHGDSIEGIFMRRNALRLLRPTPYYALRGLVQVTAVRRHNIRALEPQPETVLQAGDVVVLMGAPENLAAAEIKLLQG